MTEVHIHPTAIVEAGVEIGSGTRIFDHVHVRGPGTRIGRNCIVGGKSYVAYGVEVGDLVKINSFAYICTGVNLGTGVMVSAGAIFTNDRFPRAASPDLSRLRSSDPDEDTGHTRVLEGATIGAGAVIGPDLTIGRFAMVGMGAVVAAAVADFHLVVGNPARPIAVVCRCGPVVERLVEQSAAPKEVACARCGRRIRITGFQVEELSAVAGSE